MDAKTPTKLATAVAMSSHKIRGERLPFDAVSSRTYNDSDLRVGPSSSEINAALPGLSLPGMCSPSRNPSSEPAVKTTVCAVTTSNTAELAATAFVTLVVVFAVDSNNRMRRRTV
jgi:hypothetical protein